MKLKKEFILYNAGEETLLVPGGKAAFSGVLKGNETLGAILGLLHTDTTEQAVVKAMCEEFDAPEERITADVRKVLTALREIGALEE